MRLAWARLKVDTLGAAITLLFILATGLNAQTTAATLYGGVRDLTAGILAGVTVELVHEATGLKRSVESDDVGQFVVPLLPNGRYTLTAMRAGFKTEVLQGIQVELGTKSKIDILLVPGSLEDHVEVIADVNTLQPVNSTIGEVFDNRLMETVPLNGRQFLQLVLLAPGVAPPAPGSDLSNQASSAVNIGGAPEASNNFLLDGVDNNDLFLNNFIVNPSIDSIQEFTVLENNYDSEYGRNGGAQITIATRSGGRNFHGSAYEFLRHSGLDAKNFFDLPNESTPHLRRNQFGGTLGGPFAGSHNFFFLNSDFTRAQQAETRTTNVPSLLERNGDFSQSRVVIRDPFTGQPFSGNRIPSARLDPVGVKLAALFPAPNRNVAGQNFVTSPLETDRIGQATGKLDVNFSQANPGFIRYTFINDDRKQAFAASGPNLPGFGIGVLDRGQNLAIGATHFFTRALNDFRFGYNRLRREVLPQNNTNALASLGAQGPSLAPADRGYPKVTIAGYESLGDDPNLPILGHRETLHFSDSLSFQLGRHHMKTGLEVRRYLSNGYTHLFARGQVGFSGFLGGDALAELLLGLPTFSLLAENNNFQALRTHAVDGFFQDDWKPSRRITLNVGVRYEYNAPPVDAHDSVSIFDLKQLKIRPVGKDGVSRSGSQPDYNNIGPRFGLSWDMSGSGRLVLRSGYGIFYNTEALIANSAWYFNPPVFNLNIFTTGATLLQLSNPFPSGQGFSPLPSPVTLDPNTRTGYAQHWNLNVQTKVTGDTTVEARYVGAQGTKHFTKRNINQPLPGPGDVDSRRPIAGFGDIFIVEPSASSNYHSLQLRVEKKPGKGLSLLGAYTFSKSIDNTSAFISSTGDDNTPQNSRNTRLERGLSNFDVRHRVSIAGSYDIPSLMNKPFFRKWQISPILVIQSGRPFTPRLSVDNSNTGNGASINAHDRPNLVHDPKLSNPTPERFFDTSAFAMPAQYTFGNAGRNVLIGPGYADLDLALIKEVLTVVDQRRLQFRAEVFNVLNHPNFQLPDSYFDKPTFGHVLSAFASRQIQFALKLSF
ncbi:MAG TPA: carboxypeptidase regulatory-like domain-containing protein [Terriglobia bacterium]|nr:carboxypeptidase regulatory-like domain-containing protein [Terriglobia bacterium]